jgi:protein gp37
MICRLALKQSQNKINLEIKRNGLYLTALTCNIITAERNENERYISKEWCDLVKQKVLKVGDRLFFKLSKDSSSMMLRIIHI